MTETQLDNRTVQKQITMIFGTLLPEMISICGMGHVFMQFLLLWQQIYTFITLLFQNIWISCLCVFFSGRTHGIVCYYGAFSKAAVTNFHNFAIWWHLQIIIATYCITSGTWLLGEVLPWQQRNDVLKGLWHLQRFRHKFPWEIKG